VVLQLSAISSAVPTSFDRKPKKVNHPDVEF
jgi:hypothetical protein